MSLGVEVQDSKRFRIIILSGKLSTYPSPKSTFCPYKWDLSVNVGLGKGRREVSLSLGTPSESLHSKLKEPFLLESLSTHDESSARASRLDKVLKNSTPGKIVYIWKTERV